MAFIIPKDYKQTLMPETTEQAIQFLKASFQEKLAKPSIFVVQQLLCSY
jgi:aspartate--ammonia ligase